MIDPILFILVFIRITIILLFIPIFGSQIVPKTAKIGLCGFFATILSSYLHIDLSHLKEDLLILSILRDFIISLAIGLIIRFIFDGIQFAGECISYQMGLTIMNVIDPVSSNQVSLISNLKQLIALLIFFVIDGHHYLIKAIADSFLYIPIGRPILNKYLFKGIIGLSSTIFLIAIKLSAPILVAIFLTNLAMGMIARATPQINIFILSFPLYIGIVLLMMGIFMPFFVKFIKNQLYFMLINVNETIRSLGA